VKVNSSYDQRYQFSLSLLAPSLWPTWLGLLLFYLVTRLPASVVDQLGEAIGSYVARKNRKRYRIARTNIRLCFPGKPESEVDEMVEQSFRAQFRSLMHYSILWWGSRRALSEKIVLHGFEQLDRVRAEGKNAIMLLTHSVGLEFGAAAVQLYYPGSGMYKKMRNPVIEWLTVHGRTRFCYKQGCRVYGRDDGLRPLIKATRSGQVLVYLGDEDLGMQHSVFAPFFGVPKATLPLIGRLAKSSQAVVFPCVSCYDPQARRYNVELLPALPELTDTDGEVVARTMNEAIEKTVMLCPSQYLWTLRYFQTRPPGEASVYD
jgi:lauroyl-KDO2-lipid IV(A) myristoyltransferase